MELENTLDNKLTIENYNYETFLDDLCNYIEKSNFDIEKIKDDYDKRFEMKKDLNSFLLDYFKDIKKDVKFDLKGHSTFDKMTIENAYENTKYFPSYIDRFFENGLQKIAYHFDFEKFRDLEKLKTFITKELNDMDGSFFQADFNCEKCNCYIPYVFNLQDLTIKATNYVKPCEIERELEYKLNLEIPSKKIVFTNYFRDLLDESRYENFSLSNYKGMVEHAQAYENDNIGYVFLTNSPHIFIDEKKQNIIVGDYYFLEEYEGYKQDNQLEDFFDNYDITQDVLNEKIKKLDKFKEVGSVCTDLWAVTFMDYDQFIDLLNKKGLKEKDYDQDFFVVDINGTSIEVETNTIEVKNGDEDHKFSIKVK